MPQTPPGSASTHGEQSGKVSRLLIVALVLGAIASLISGYLIYFDHGSSGFGFSEKLLFAPQTLPVFPATTYSQKNGFKLITVEGQGTATILAYAHGTSRNYYLLAENDATQSNIYVSDPKQAKTGLSQRTHSPSFKLGLSYDAQSDSLAYVTLGTGTTSTITLLQSGTSTERTFGAGSNPVLLKGGFIVVYENNGQLYSLNIDSGKAVPLLSVPNGGSYAVDAENLKLVIYDPNTDSVQYFNLKNYLNANAESIEHLSTNLGPRMLVLSGNNLVQLLTSKEGIFLPIESKHSRVTALPDSSAYIGAAVTFYEN